MCDAATITELKMLVSREPMVVRKAYLVLLAEHYGLPSLVDALNGPKTHAENYERRKASDRRKKAREKANGVAPSESQRGKALSLPELRSLREA